MRISYHHFNSKAHHWNSFSLLYDLFIPRAGNDVSIILSFQTSPLDPNKSIRTSLNFTKCHFSRRMFPPKWSYRKFGEFYCLPSINVNLYQYKDLNDTILASFSGSHSWWTFWSVPSYATWLKGGGFFVDVTATKDLPSKKWYKNPTGVLCRGSPLWFHVMGRFLAFSGGYKWII